MAASGMMPVFIASTWANYGEALKSLKAQFQAGDPAVVEAKLAELTQGIKDNPQAVRNAIASYMTEMYRLGRCGVSLQEAGYRLRPASEVIRSAYGTQAELVNWMWPCSRLPDWKPKWLYVPCIRQKPLTKGCLPSYRWLPKAN